ncbi:ChbG/HpnK family deacetylase [archaeon]|nr:ChbG/HpnK family deacetylase [archaeon]
MRRLIICADDFGMTAGVNQAILATWKAGVTTDASLLVNAMAFDDAVRIAKANPGIEVGLHVNLTSYRPVLPHSKVKTLCTKQGAFVRPDLAHWDFSNFDRASEREIEAEVRAQYNLFVKKLGRKPSHLDSHKCEHGDPKVLEIVKKLALENSLPVRTPIWHWQQNYTAEAELRRAGVRTPDALVPVDFIEGLNVDLKNFAAFDKALVDGVTELIVMPGFVDEELLRSTSFAWQRARTFAILMNPDFKNKIREAGIQLVSYKDL